MQKCSWKGPLLNIKCGTKTLFGRLLWEKYITCSEATLLMLVKPFKLEKCCMENVKTFQDPSEAKLDD